MARVRTLDEQPVIVQWEVARPCLSACLRCRRVASDDVDAVPLSAVEALDVAAQIVEIGAVRLVLSGGDFRARPDLDGIIRAATDGGLEVTVSLCTPSVAPSTLRRIALAGARAVALALDPRRSVRATTAVARRIAASAARYP